MRVQARRPALPCGDPGLEWIDMRDNTGSGEMRSQSIVLGKWCLEIYDILTKNDPDFFDWWSYDWEVIPAMLKHAVCKDGKALDVPRRLRLHRRRADRSAQRRPAGGAGVHLGGSSREACKSEAKKQWAYEDLVTDDWKKPYRLQR